MRNVSFGPFTLCALERRLEKDGRPIAIGSRAFDILIALVARAGAVVDKQELVARVWPGINVEESSLRVHIAGLRKTLGDGCDGARYIANVRGRGYCFVCRIADHGGADVLERSVVAASDTALLRLLHQALAARLARIDEHERADAEHTQDI